MKAGSPHPIGLVVALLLAACDGSSHPSVTAPPLPPRPAPPNDSLTHTGTVTILGLASSDPADTCIAGSVRRNVGREWPISIALRLDASRPYGVMTTPLLPVAECAFDFSAASRYEFTACGFSSSDWPSVRLAPNRDSSRSPLWSWRRTSTVIRVISVCLRFQAPTSSFSTSVRVCWKFSFKSTCAER